MKKSNPMRLLEEADTAFEAFEYEGESGRIDGVSVAGRLGFPVESVFKTLVATAPDKRCAVFVIPVACTLDLKAAARAIRAPSLAMLPQAQLFALTGYVHGGCSPIGMKKNLPTIIDSRAEGQPCIHVNGGRIGLMLRLSPAALAAFTGAAFATVARA